MRKQTGGHVSGGRRSHRREERWSEGEPQCTAESCVEQLPADRTVFEPDTEQWSPADLIGRFRDVTHCDHCRRELLPTDEGYIAYWVVSREELRLLEEVQREQPSDKSAEPGASAAQ